MAMDYFAKLRTLASVRHSSEHRKRSIISNQLTFAQVSPEDRDPVARADVYQSGNAEPTVHRNDLASHPSSGVRSNRHDPGCYVFR
jgi:hypothetical protein